MDKVTPQKRSLIMAQVKSKGNLSTEIRLLKIFKLNNIKGWRRNYPLHGKPDFIFQKLRLAIFIDGCFWHGCKAHCRLPETNKEYWINKIQRNKKRDQIITKELRVKDWTVIRLWEHELRNRKCMKKLKHIKGLSQPSA